MSTARTTNRQLIRTECEPICERPGHFDWEVLADADAEYQAWLDQHRAEAIAAIDAEASPANDNSRS